MFKESAPLGFYGWGGVGNVSFSNGGVPFLVNDNTPVFVSDGDDGGDLINGCMGLSLALPAHSQTHVRLITSAGHTKNVNMYCPGLAWAPARDNKKLTFYVCAARVATLLCVTYFTNACPLGAHEAQNMQTSPSPHHHHHHHRTTETPPRGGWVFRVAAAGVSARGGFC